MSDSEVRRLRSLLDDAYQLIDDVIGGKYLEGQAADASSDEDGEPELCARVLSSFMAWREVRDAE